MCRGCGRIKYVAPTVRSRPIEESYRTEEEVLIVYSGDIVRRVTGCKSGHRYLFAPNAVRRVDKCDAGCLVDMKEFEYGE